MIAANANAGTIYSFDFQTDPLKAGWTYTPSEANGKMVFIASEGFYPDKGGKLTSPAIPCTDNRFQYYRISFKSKAEAREYWCVFFQDKDGKDVIADIYASFYPSTNFVNNVVCIRGRESATAFTMNFQATKRIEIRDLKIEAIDGAGVCDRSDKLYASIPPLKWTPPTNRLARIPNFMKKLKAGGKLRIVMLGDSIINDTNNSLWDALLMRMYPQAEIQIIPSVLGSTGCWKYREEPYFKTYVADQKPDLLMIGGISHQSNSLAIKEVIEMTKKQVGCDIILMSGPMGADTRPHVEGDMTTPLPKGTYGGNPFNEVLRTLADEQNIEFIDMNTIWYSYLYASEKPFEFFHRDILHADDRGKQVLGRVLEAYFKP